MTNPSMSHEDFQALLPGYLEENALDAATRAAADAHLAGCTECAALAADLRRIIDEAGTLPALAPSHDLWAGVEARIEATVVPLDGGTGGQSHERTDEDVGELAGGRALPPTLRPQSWRRIAIAASALIAVTAGVTYTLARRTAPPQIAVGSTQPPLAPPPATAAPAGRAVNASRPSAEATFDREISSLRQIVDARRAELDTATVAVLEKNLKLIDKAIAESRAALAKDPASPFLADLLNRSYDSKLQLLRDVATLPSRS